MNIFKQRNVGWHWGILAQTFSQVSIFVAALNLLLLTVTAYNTTLVEWFLVYGIPLNFWSFMSIIAFMLLITSILVYKFALPSLFSFTNEQAYRHDNPIRKDIKQLQETLDTNLKEIRDRLERLENKDSEEAT